MEVHDTKVPILKLTKERVLIKSQMELTTKMTTVCTECFHSVSRGVAAAGIPALERISTHLQGMSRRLLLSERLV